jgi:hypothetical protein
MALKKYKQFTADQNTISTFLFPFLFITNIGQDNSRSYFPITEGVPVTLS